MAVEGRGWGGIAVSHMIFEVVSSACFWLRFALDFCLKMLVDQEPPRAYFSRIFFGVICKLMLYFSFSCFTC